MRGSVLKASIFNYIFSTLLHTTLPPTIFRLISYRKLLADASSAGQPLWNKPSYKPLVLFILWILSSTNPFREPRASLEQEKITHRTCQSPVKQRIRSVACPLIENHPNSLLGSKIGVARPGP